MVNGELYLINLNDKQSKETHWLSLFIDRNTVVYYDSFGLEYILQSILNKVKDKSINHYVVNRIIRLYSKYVI